MPNLLRFNRRYAAFTEDIRPFEKADDVGFVISSFLSSCGAPRYPIGDLIDARVCAVWLGSGTPDAYDQDNLDLVFEIGGSGSSRNYEIVLRSASGTVYGGSLAGIGPRVTDEIACAHRVLVTELGGHMVKYAFNGLVYLPIGSTDLNYH